MKSFRILFLIAFIVLIVILGVFHVSFKYSKDDSIKTTGADVIHSGGVLPGEKPTGAENAGLLSKNERETVEDKIRRLLQGMEEDERSTGQGPSLSAVSLQMKSAVGDLSPLAIFELFTTVNFDFNGDSHGASFLMSLLEDNYGVNASVSDLEKLVSYLQSDHLEWQDTQISRLIMSVGDNSNRAEFDAVFKMLFKSAGLSSHNEILVSSLANAVARVSDSESAELLFAALDNTDPVLKNASGAALPLIHNENAFPALANIIESDNSSLVQKLAAIQVMGQINSEASVINLKTLVNDENSSIAEAANRALTQITSLRNYDPFGPFGSTKEQPNEGKL